MNKDAQALMSLLFDEDEQVCVSPDKFAYRSLSQEDLGKGSFLLVPNSTSRSQVERFCSLSEVQLLALNPISGDRCDENCTSLRTFLVEMDDGTLGEQLSYVNAMRMPYSACVFSGGKSLHFAITLDAPLPSLELYRYYAEWILNVMSRADQNTKNPSRMIRFPGTMRNSVEQKLVEIRGRISMNDLNAFLSPYDGLKPRVYEKREIPDNVDVSVLVLPEWVQEDLVNGLDTSKGRNNRWFAIAYECGLHGWDEDATIDLLGQYFSEERDFRRKEWEYTVRHAVRRAQKDHG